MEITYCKIVNLTKKVFFLLYIFILINCGGKTVPTVLVEPDKPIKIEPIINKPIEVVISPPLPPTPISIRSIEYDLEKMIIIWNKAKDTNFVSYTLYQQKDALEEAEVLETYETITDTSYELKIFDPTKKNTFHIVNENTYELKTKGKSRSNDIEIIKPNEPILLDIEHSEDLFIKWMMNDDYDFDHYEILKSKQVNMEENVVVKKIFDQRDTSLVIAMDAVFFYQVKTRDKWGLESSSNVIRGDILVNALGKQFSLIETTTIDLSYKNIVGEIPDDISILKNLTTLKLNNNFFTGSIPIFIYKMKNLEFINLSHNSLSGSLSSDIGFLSNLKELWITENQFSGKLPVQIGQLNNLTYLNISKNKFQGTIPQSIGNLKKLKYLNGWNNNFSGFLPSTIGDLISLEFLSFGSNSLIGEIPSELGNAKKLKSIGLFENNLIGPIPVEVSELPSLEYLGLFDNQLDGFIPDPLFNKGSLYYLKLDKNNFSDLNHNLICKSGFNWDNNIFFDISDNLIPKHNNNCAYGIMFYEIYNSY